MSNAAGVMVPPEQMSSDALQQLRDALLITIGLALVEQHTSKRGGNRELAADLDNLTQLLIQAQPTTTAPEADPG